jgi:hypothetical protein
LQQPSAFLKPALLLLLLRRWRRLPLPLLLLCCRWVHPMLVLQCTSLRQTELLLLLRWHLGLRTSCCVGCQDPLDCLPQPAMNPSKAQHSTARHSMPSDG